MDNYLNSINNYSINNIYSNNMGKLDQLNKSDSNSKSINADSENQVDSTINALKEKKDKKALQEACQGFEAIMLNTMLKSMRATIPEDSLLGKSNTMDIYTSMQDQYLAEKISQGNNRTGIGEYLYRQLQDSI